MNRDQNEHHAKQVDAWIEKSVKGLAQDSQARIFGDAIQTLQKRTLVTLSSVTWNVILDRALCQSVDEFPLLAGIKIEASGISIDGLLPNLQGKEANQVNEAFRFFLIELLTIIENLTAGILTEPLYRELSRVVARDKSSTEREDV